MTVQASSDVPGYRITVVIPTLNEARNLPHVLARIPRDVHEVIVVDGHSVDDTLTVARKLWPNVRIVMQTRTKQNVSFWRFWEIRAKIYAWHGKGGGRLTKSGLKLSGC